MALDSSFGTSCPSKVGRRSQKPSLNQLSWVVLNLGDRHAPRETCCSFCSPLMTNYTSLTARDPRLCAYSSDFLFPLQINPPPITPATTQIPRRPHASSITSNISTRSGHSALSESLAIAIPMSRVVFVPVEHKFTLH